MKKVALMLLVVCFVLAVNSCAKQKTFKEQIVGEWVIDTSSTEYLGREAGEDSKVVASFHLEFRADGKILSHANGEINSAGIYDIYKKGEDYYLRWNSPQAGNLDFIVRWWNPARKKYTKSGKGAQLVWIDPEVENEKERLLFNRVQ